MAEKKKKSKFKRILKGLKKAAILGGTAWGASKLFGGRPGKQFGGPLARPGVAPVRPLGFKSGARVKKAHGGKSKK